MTKTTKLDASPEALREVERECWHEFERCAYDLASAWNDSGERGPARIDRGDLLDMIYGHMDAVASRCRLPEARSLALLCSTKYETWRALEAHLKRTAFKERRYSL